jgi:cell shape-determining protein MreD
MKNLILFTSFILALLLEVTVVRLPLVLFLLLIIFVRKKNPEIFVFALFIGILLDILNLQRIGITSMFFLALLFLVHLYDRKYEINTLPFVLISCVGSVLGQSFISYNSVIWIHILASIFIGGAIFFLNTQLDL